MSTLDFFFNECDSISKKEILKIIIIMVLVLRFIKYYQKILVTHINNKKYFALLLISKITFSMHLSLNSSKESD